MIKSIKHLLRAGLVSNLAMALIAVPSNMIIPQQQLNTAFNIPVTPIQNEVRIQIPVEFIYMSQGFSSFHPGIDLATKFGTPNKPIMAGTVEEAGFSIFGYGNEVIIDNGNGRESLYAHLSKIEVKKGETVDTDTVIGLVGSTGHSTGPHLHLEIHENGRAINPLSILTLKEQTSFTLSRL